MGASSPGRTTGHLTSDQPASPSDIVDLDRSDGPAPGGNWHALPIADVLDSLDTNKEHGLSGAATQKRLDRFGPNEIREAAGPTWRAVLIRQFVDVLIVILVIAAVISFATRSTG